MSITAESMGKAGSRGRELNTIVKEHLQIIDDRLLRAERTWGKNILRYELPVNVIMPGLDKSSAQRLLYCAIMQSLEERRFTTKIEIKPDRSTLYIIWSSSITSASEDAMTTFLKKRIVR